MSSARTHPMRGCTDPECSHARMRANARRSHNANKPPRLNRLAEIEKAILGKPEIRNSELMAMGFEYFEIKPVRDRAAKAIA